MKRAIALALTFLLLLTAAGCGDSVTVTERGPYTVGITDGVESVALTVDPINQTITAENGDVYTYTITSTEVTFRYPSGESYLWDFANGIGYGSLIQPEEGYLDYSTLEAALSEEVEAVTPAKSKNPGYLFFAFFCFLIGGLNLAFPYAGWYLKYGWRFKDAEPSDAALVLNRVAGGILVIIGIVFLFI